MATDFQVERLDRDDDAGVHRLLVELGVEEQRAYDHPQETRAEIAARLGPIGRNFLGENVVYVARKGDGRAVGLCWCVLFDPGTGLEGEVAELYVEPAARGGGVASALVAAAARLFRDRSVTFAAVWTRDDNAAALSVYGRHGFSPTQQAVLTWLPLPIQDPDQPDRRPGNNGGE